MNPHFEIDNGLPEHSRSLGHEIYIEYRITLELNNLLSGNININSYCQLWADVAV